MQAFKGLKAKAKDLDFGLKDQGQGLTSLLPSHKAISNTLQ